MHKMDKTRKRVTVLINEYKEGDRKQTNNYQKVTQPLDTLCTKIEELPRKLKC